LNLSGASNFYRYLLLNRQKDSGNTLVNRVRSHAEGTNLMKYILDTGYYNSVKRSHKTKVPNGIDGVTDSLRCLFTEYNDSARSLVHTLLDQC